MIYIFNMFSPKIFLHTCHENGIHVILYPQRDTRVAAGTTPDHWLLFQLLAKVEPTWIQIRFPLDGKLLDWTVQQRLKIGSRNVTIRTASRPVEFLGGEVEMTERVIVEEGHP